MRRYRREDLPNVTYNSFCLYAFGSLLSTVIGGQQSVLDKVAFPQWEATQYVR